MKKIIWIVSLIVASGSWSFAQNQDQYHDNNTDDVYYNDNTNYNEQQADNDGMSYQTFYDQLSPYGNWIDYPGIGYVWAPQMDDPGFSPYMTSGHWVYTDMGWTWVSDYAWGWATFHYGRWFMDPNYGGWLWIPGYDWAPAWVNWGMYEGYYVWEPIGPWDYVGGRSYWRHGDHYYYGDHDHHWNCLPREHMGEEHISNYVVSNTVVNHDKNDFERRVTTINNNSTYKRSVFNAGPRAEEVQKVVGHPIAKVAINSSPNPGKTEVRGNQVNVYRPVINRTTPTQHAIPAKVVNPSEVQHNNSTPARNEQQRTSPQQTTPARENTNPYQTRPSNQSWTPPRQSTPRVEPQQQPRQNYQPQPRQSEPVQQYRPSGGFIPSERPAQMQQRSMPAPSFHAPSGGGRHR